MTNLYGLFVLLADRSKWERLGDGLHGENAKLGINELLALVALVAGALLFVSLLHAFVSRQERKRSYHHPKRLFGELCTAHRISKQDRLLLKRLADCWKFNQPAMLFVKPDKFDRDIVKNPSSKDAESIERLRCRLFGTVGEPPDLAA